MLYSKNQVYRETAILKQYLDFSEVILLKNCRQAGYEEIKKNKKSNTDEVERCSKSRVKRKIRDYALMNNFTYFYTQTINSNYDRFNLNEFCEIIEKKFKAYKRKNKDFIYLVIYEKHKNGAYHLHGLIGGVGVDLHKNLNGYDTLGFFEDIGFNSVSLIKDKNKVSNYILKYISKDFCKTSSGVSYFHSKGLLLPIEKKIIINDFSNLKLKFESDFCKKYEVIKNV